MKREIKFRGYYYKTNSWLYGNLIEKDDPQKEQPTPWVRLIHNRALTAEMVQFDSVGQFTGLYDKNGKEIYEGDIVKWVSIHNDSPKDHVDKIEWLGEHACFMLMPFVHEPYAAIMEVIGNIYENPELLK